MTRRTSTGLILAMTLACGMASGTALTVGHELGHKQGRIDRLHMTRRGHRHLDPSVPRH